MITILVFVRR